MSSLRIAVVGLGKIGLPLAAQYASRGNTIIGVDVNAATVDMVNAGHEPFPGEEGLAAKLRELTPTGALSATTDYSVAIPDSDVVVVVVPLFVDGSGKPDFGWMDSATAEIAANLSADTLVIYETTLPVGTTRTRWVPALQAGSGLTEGTDFHVAFSPERVLTGRVFADLRKYPKLVGTVSQTGAALVRDFYERVLEFDARTDLPRPNGVWDLGSAEAAEMAKLAETTYRDVNIGLANQFAVFAESSGIDIYQVIEACNSQPFSHIHQPGISVGGHCIPVYPRLYLTNDPAATVVRAAREANAGMPGHAVEVLERTYGSLTGARVAVLGATYRPGVKETAFSGVFATIAELENRGAITKVHDPTLEDDELRRLGLEPFHLGTNVDAVVIHTAHELYRALTAEHVPGARVLVDGRNVIVDANFPGVAVLTIGRAG